MKLRLVDSEASLKQFLLVNVKLQKHLPEYIRPLDKDVLDVFDEKKNKSFRHGKCVQYILEDENGNSIGRIAAFTNRRYKNKGDKFPVGCFGFFECINSQPAADMLLNAAADWLKKEGVEAMDGPVNFGERDKWWGLLVEGFQSPLYGVTYNPPYYQELLQQYGCRVFYYQNCWARSVEGKLEEKFYQAHDRIKALGGYSVQQVRKNNLEKYAADFVAVYNQAWAGHEGNKAMELKQAIIMFNKMKPVMDEDLLWFAYYNNEPIAFYLNLPDLNQAFKYLDGKFNLLAKLKFLYYRRFITRFTGIVFGVIPGHQGQGVDYFLIVEAADHIQATTRYRETELQWQGDFLPKMNNISRNLGFKRSRRLAVFRCIFDSSLPFERHPLIN